MTFKKLTPLAIALMSTAAFAAPASAQTMTSTFETVYFDYNKATQSLTTQAQLENIRSLVSTCTAAQTIDVVGHTDTSGSAVYNKALSERRAVKIKNELVALGVPANLITTRGAGESEPIIPGDNLKNETNRRVEIRLDQDASCGYVEPAYVEPVYQEPVYQPAPEPVVEYVPEPAPVYTPAPAPVATPAPVPTPAPVAAPVAAPTAGGFNWGLIAAGIGAAGIVALIASDDDEPSSP